MAQVPLRVHVADCVARPVLHGPRGAVIAGAILLSGIFDLTTIPPIPPIKADYGEAAGPYAERSALPGLVRTAVPLSGQILEFVGPGR